MGGNGEAFAEGDGGDQNINLADHLAAPRQVSLDVGGKDGSLMREGQNVVS